MAPATVITMNSSVAYNLKILITFSNTYNGINLVFVQLSAIEYT